VPAKTKSSGCARGDIPSRVDQATDQNEPPFAGRCGISTWLPDTDATEDGVLVALNSKDRVSRAAFEFL